MANLLPPFAGVRSEYDDFRLAIRSGASRASATDINGLLGFLLPPAEYLAKFTVAFIPLAHPGVEPVMANMDTERLWKQWKHKLDQFQQQRRDLSAFTDSLFGSLSADILATLTDEDGDRLSLALTYAALENKFGKISPADFAARIATLDIPFADGTEDFQAIIARHEAVHRVAVKAAQPLSEQSKVEYLRRAVNPCGRFVLEIDAWQRANRGLDSQTFTSLRDALVAAWAERSITATAASLGFAGASTTNQLAAVNSLTIEDITVAFAAAMRTFAPPHGVVAAAPIKRVAQASAKQYCWTHGPCNHSSAACRAPDDHHVASASFADMKGGRTTFTSKRNNRPLK
jgi:hypothetical protein